MSVVTGIVIWTGLEPTTEHLKGPDEVHWIAAANKWLRQRFFMGLEQFDERMSRGKHPQVIVAGAGYNHFPAREFVEWLMDYSWEAPDDVVIIVKTEDGPTEIWRPYK